MRSPAHTIPAELTVGSKQKREEGRGEKGGGSVGFLLGNRSKCSLLAFRTDFGIS